LVLIDSLDEVVQEIENNIDDGNTKVDLLWNNHQLADEREARGEVFLGAYLSASPGHEEFFLVRAGTSFRGAVLAMIAAADQGERIDELRREVARLEQLMRSDVSTAYAEFKGLIDSLRLQSQRAINAESASVRTFQQNKRAEETRRDRLRLVFVGLSLLGLAMVLLKDLPVWKREDRSG